MIRKLEEEKEKETYRRKNAQSYFNNSYKSSVVP